MVNSEPQMLGFYLVLYAFVSWAAETVFFAFWEGRFVNRGFLNLPLNLPCGLTAAILIAALIALFILAVKYSGRIEERLLTWIYTIGKGKTP